MTSSRALFFSCLSLALCAGCGGDSTPGDSSPKDMATQPEQDMSTGDTSSLVDMSVDKPDASKVDMCQPLTSSSCSAELCGDLDDGCGGVVACDLGCKSCSDGVPDDPTCGTCGLGASSCNGEVLECNLPEALTGVACDKVIYVDSQTSGANVGTKEEPFASLDQAYKLIEDQAFAPPVLVVFKEGSHSRGPVMIRDGVSLVGGFDSQWRYEPQMRTRFQIDASPVPGASRDRVNVGFQATSIESPTLVANLDIVTSDATTAGQSVVGIFVEDSSMLSLEHIKASAGKGKAGTNGANSVPGAAGLNGPDAADPIVSNMNNPDKIFYSSVETIAPAPTSLNCVNAQGGNGAEGVTSRAKVNGIYRSVLGDPGRDAQGYDSSASPPTGGKGGVGGVYFGGDGESGKDGARGRDAVGGRYIERNGKYVTMSLLHSDLDIFFLDGGDGTPGLPGTGGGGGGSGRSHFEFNSNSEIIPRIVSGAGGAGGSGGCAAGPSEGGQAGGSSVGLYVHKSPELKISHSTFTAFDGGSGGAGGNGAAGGVGGGGGDQGEGATIEGFSGYSGGNGGNGGQGGASGNAGGGAGGMSVGAFCTEKLALSQENTFSHSKAGRGGASKSMPSASIGSPAGQGAGADGLEDEQLGCQ